MYVPCLYCDTYIPMSLVCTAEQVFSYVIKLSINGSHFSLSLKKHIFELYFGVKKTTRLLGRNMAS